MYEIIYLLAILSVIFISNYAVLKLGSNYYNDEKEVELFDISHLILPDLHSIHYITDIIALCGIISIYFLSNIIHPLIFLLLF